ncbi:MAG: hypothetical protein P8N31_02580 [Planctomycetota bacterium]|nr:hypothetical protein [Planctomycetota bacterium]MDG2142415.1 hypothetical protein [Planctomycetota bacterium]
MKTSTQFLALSCLALGASLMACTAPQVGSGDQQLVTQVTPPLDLDAKAYDMAMSLELPPVEPMEYEGMYNVFKLSEQIVSGSEPIGEAAFSVLQDMGIRTIISVDGKVPDAELAARYGMRYVHIPIQYSDISKDEMLRLAKTYRELDGPFYVHCFHGRHRGPAGAEVGRLVLDGIQRAEAIAEMRQYCGTSKKYEGLYRIVAAGDMPTAEETAAFEYDFAEKEEVDGVVGSMVILARAFDNNEVLRDSGWLPDPMHPDLDPLNEALQLLQGFQAGEHLSEVRTSADDFRSWWSEGLEESKALVDSVKQIAAGNLDAVALADRSFLAIETSCLDCHGEYRND